MEQREIKTMQNYYFGMSRVPMICEEKIEELHKSKVIRKIYEVFDNEFNEIWYLVKTVKGKSYIVKSKFGNLYAKDIMKNYRKYYDYYQINTEIIKIFAKGFYPVIFKVSDREFNIFYDKKNNKNNIFFNNYYCYSKNKYKAVREYRNKVEYEIFINEDDAIYWTSDYSKTKEEILKNNIRPFNLKEMVYDLKQRRGRYLDVRW